MYATSISFHSIMMKMTLHDQKPHICEYGRDAHSYEHFLYVTLAIAASLLCCNEKEENLIRFTVRKFEFCGKLWDCEIFFSQRDARDFVK